MPSNNVTDADLTMMLSHIEEIINVMTVVSEELKSIYLDIFSNYLTRED